MYRLRINPRYPIGDLSIKDRAGLRHTIHARSAMTLIYMANSYNVTIKDATRYMKYSLGAI